MALVVGVTVRIKDGCPVLRGVVIDEADQTAVSRRFEYATTAGTEPEVQLLDLVQALSSQLQVQPIRAAALMEAGFAARAGLTKETKLRLRGEGAAVGVLRGATHLVTLGDKRVLGNVVGLSGPELVTKGKALAGAADADAAGAALVACAL